jgi:type I restriction enzyme S subunit
MVRSKNARDELDRIPTLAQRFKQAVLRAAWNGDLTQQWRAERGIPLAWEPLMISAVAEVVTGFTPPTKEGSRFFGGNVPFYKPTDLDAGYYVKKARETLTEAGASIGRRVPEGSTLVTCADCCTNQQINALIPDRTKLVPEWLFWMAVSPDFQNSILANSSATTLPIINKGRFQHLALRVPCLEEQSETVRRIEEMLAYADKIAVEVEHARKLLDRLDQAILAKAFRGGLVAADAAEQPKSGVFGQPLETARIPA